MKMQDSGNDNTTDKMSFWDRVYKNLNIFKFILDVFIGLVLGLILNDFFKLFDNFYINLVIWEIITLATTFIIRRLLFLQIEIKKELEKYKSEINETMCSHKSEIGKIMYAGIFRLLSGKDKEDFSKFKPLEKFEDQIRDIARSDSSVRGTILDFLVSSMASIGNDGFAKLNSTVSDYADYFNRLSIKSKDMSMTCVVRPYFFVTDEIENVTLPPVEPDPQKYGKSEHLKIDFSKKKDKNIQRILIVNEVMLSEMFLTPIIDKMYRGIDQNSCYLCNNNDYSDKCPYHNEEGYVSINDKDGLTDIHEIMWFDKKVNEEKGVDLIYTFITNEAQRKCKELDDRIFIRDTNPELDIRFELRNFTSSPDEGILRIRWGEGNSTTICLINNSYLENNNPVNLKEGKIDNRRGHRFYNSIKKMLGRNRDESRIKNKMIDYLEEISFSIDNSINNDNIKKPFIKSINILKRLLNNKNLDLLMIYKILIKFYNDNKQIPKIFFNVTYDTQHLDHPIRPVSWYDNWIKINK